MGHPYRDFTTKILTAEVHYVPCRASFAHVYQERRPGARFVSRTTKLPNVALGNIVQLMEELTPEIKHRTHMLIAFSKHYVDHRYSLYQSIISHKC